MANIFYPPPEEPELPSGPGTNVVVSGGPSKDDGGWNDTGTPANPDPSTLEKVVQGNDPADLFPKASVFGSPATPKSTNTGTQGNPGVSAPAPVANPTPASYIAPPPLDPKIKADSDDLVDHLRALPKANLPLVNPIATPPVSDAQSAAIGAAFKPAVDSKSSIQAKLDAALRLMPHDLQQQS